jgi:hypothetical protein
MSNLLPDETELVGRWIERDGKLVADETCQRIHDLTNGILDIVQDHPRGGGWVRLFRDRTDGRLWERSYPEGGLHGGGPAMLRCISKEEAMETYKFGVESLPKS